MSEVITVGDKPILLKAIELVLAEPAAIRKEALQLKDKYVTRYGSDRSEDEINAYAADKIISNYSYYTAFVGGTTALTGVIPGLGTVLAAFGGATANTALSMKYQIEMTMAIATIYGRDITIEEEKRLCLMIAGLGAISEMTRVGGKEPGKKASVKMMQQYLQDASLQTLRELFKKSWNNLHKKSCRKSYPVWRWCNHWLLCQQRVDLVCRDKGKGFFLGY